VLRGALQHQYVGFARPEVSGKVKGDIVKTQEELENSHRGDEATGGIEHPALDQKVIGRLAYFYWEERGCPNDSADEDWFRAEAELRNRLAATASE
jgi:hypothetical protein